MELAEWYSSRGLGYVGKRAANSAKPIWLVAFPGNEAAMVPCKLWLGLAAHRHSQRLAGSLTATHMLSPNTGGRRGVGRSWL